MYTGSHIKIGHWGLADLCCFNMHKMKNVSSECCSHEDIKQDYPSNFIKISSIVVLAFKKS